DQRVHQQPGKRPDDCDYDPPWDMDSTPPTRCRQDGDVADRVTEQGPVRLRPAVPPPPDEVVPGHPALSFGEDRWTEDTSTVKSGQDARRAAGAGVGVSS